MEKTIIKLLPNHRGDKSSTFTGRPQGIEVRKSLGLNHYDQTDEPFIIEVPSGTSSFNPSFYLGLFFDSIKYLGGMVKFKDKYELSIVEEDPEVKEGLLEDFLECERQAINEYFKETGLDF